MQVSGTHLRGDAGERLHGRGVYRRRGDEGMASRGATAREARWAEDRRRRKEGYQRNGDGRDRERDRDRDRERERDSQRDDRDRRDWDTDRAWHHRDGRMVGTDHPRDEQLRGERAGSAGIAMAGSMTGPGTWGGRGSRSGMRTGSRSGKEPGAGEQPWR